MTSVLSPAALTAAHFPSVMTGTPAFGVLLTFSAPSALKSMIREPVGLLPAQLPASRCLSSSVLPALADGAADGAGAGAGAGSGGVSSAGASLRSTLMFYAGL